MVPVKLLIQGDMVPVEFPRKTFQPFNHHRTFPNLSRAGGLHRIKAFFCEKSCFWKFETTHFLCGFPLDNFLKVKVARNMFEEEPVRFA